MRSQIKILPHQIHERAHPHGTVKQDSETASPLIQWHIPQWQSGLYCNLIIRKAIQKWWCWNCLFDLIKSSCHRGSASFLSFKGCSAPWKSALMWLHSGRQPGYCQRWLGHLQDYRRHSQTFGKRPLNLRTWLPCGHIHRHTFSFRAHNVEQFVDYRWSSTVCLADSTHLPLASI